MRQLDDDQHDDPQRDRLGAALARAADEVVDAARAGGHHQEPIEEYDEDQAREAVLSRITEAVVHMVPAVAAAGVTQTDPDGQVRSYAGTTPWVSALDRWQADLGEGPCIEAAAPGTSTLVNVGDLRAEGPGRWPRWTTFALEAGVQAMHSITLAPYRRPVGALNLYATFPGEFTDTDQLVADAFASQAAIALWGISRAAQLTRAVASRVVIGQAKGILIERFTLTDQQAFDMLVRASQETNIKLRDVAAWLAREAQPCNG